MVTRFEDRTHAGKLLAKELLELDYPGSGASMVVALPRGGVAIGAEVARALGIPLDVLIVRKLGVPWQPELAMGAIAEGDFEVLDRELIHKLHISPAEVAEVRTREQAELIRRQRLYRGEHALKDVPSKVILVDDGIATGATVEVAIQALRARGADTIALAVPVAAPETVYRLRHLADDVICLLEPAPLVAIGQWYEEFEAVPDAAVIRILAAAHAAQT
ncbi:MAG: phosphoribosyltransferase family protein [Bryobacteraceae bacterium]